jgi:hypothetical protein
MILLCREDTEKVVPLDQTRRYDFARGVLRVVALWSRGVAEHHWKSLEIKENKMHPVRHGRVRKKELSLWFLWRPRPESNRRARICSPREFAAVQWLGCKTTLNPPAADQWLTSEIQNAARDFYLVAFSQTLNGETPPTVGAAFAFSRGRQVAA